MPFPAVSRRKFMVGAAALVAMAGLPKLAQTFAPFDWDKIAGDQLGPNSSVHGITYFLSSVKAGSIRQIDEITFMPKNPFEEMSFRIDKCYYEHEDTRPDMLGWFEDTPVFETLDEGDLNHYTSTSRADDGPWKGLMFQTIRAQNRIARTTRRGRGNVIVHGKATTDLFARVKASSVMERVAFHECRDIDPRDVFVLYSNLRPRIGWANEIRAAEIDVAFAKVVEGRYVAHPKLVEHGYVTRFRVDW